MLTFIELSLTVFIVGCEIALVYAGFFSQFAGK